MSKWLCAILNFILLIVSVDAYGSSDGRCHWIADKAAETLIPKSRLFSQSCLELSGSNADKAGEERSATTFLIFLSLNNPMKGAESYLVVADITGDVGGETVRQILGSQQVGMEAFPILHAGHKGLMAVLTPFESNKVYVATNVLTFPTRTEAKIWEIDTNSLSFKGLNGKLFSANQLPEIRGRKGAWSFRIAARSK